jgi:two-component system sensor histidine kinase SenX3
MWPRKPSGESRNKLELPEIFLNSLEALEGATIVIAPGDVPIFASSDAEKIGILREGKIVSEELLATIRVVRRTNTKQNGKIEIARGPIGEGKHELMVNVIPLVEGNLVLVLLRDESEADRIHEVRRDFVANISHELKTPIGALSLLSEAVLGAKDDPQSVSKFAARMQSEAKRLTDLVQEIISLSRVQDSDPLQVPEILDVKEMIFEAIDQCKTTAEARKIQIVFSGDATEKVLGDRLQLIMAIHNLIENAINYSPESTNVSITATTEDSIIDISVSDQGIGIPESEVERIFERFYRVDPARSRQTGGTGLGLSIVKHIVTNHGGDIKVWSVENVGSTFSIRLPITQENESQR